jgi:hypothetical protein
VLGGGICGGEIFWFELLFRQREIFDPLCLDLGLMLFWDLGLGWMMPLGPSAVLRVTCLFLMILGFLFFPFDWDALGSGDARSRFWFEIWVGPEPGWLGL